MLTPLQITSRDFTPSEALNAAIAAEVKKLERYCDRIISCHVTVEMPHKHHRKGKHFVVRIDLGLPGHDLVVHRDTAEQRGHENAFLAVADAFRAARRQLQDTARRRRGEVKRHSLPSPEAHSLPAP